MTEKYKIKENDIDLIKVNEKFYVGSNGEFPEKIYFNRIDAFSSYHAYIDSFDETGVHYAAYKFVDNVYRLNF